MRGQFHDAHDWLTKAAGDPLLADYALYWQAQTDRSLGSIDLAIEELRQYRQLYPNSVMSDAAVDALAQSALSVNRPDDAVAALVGYPTHHVPVRRWCCCVRKRASGRRSQETNNRLPRQPITSTWSTGFR